LNGVMAVILRYFIEFGSFRGALRKSGVDVKSSRSLSHLLISFLSVFAVDTVLQFNKDLFACDS